MTRPARRHRITTLYPHKQSHKPTVNLPTPDVPQQRTYRLRKSTLYLRTAPKLRRILAHLFHPRTLLNCLTIKTTTLLTDNSITRLLVLIIIVIPQRTCNLKRPFYFCHNYYRFKIESKNHPKKITISLLHYPTILPFYHSTILLTTND